MNDTVISIEDLGKRYSLGRLRAKGEGLRHVLEDKIMWPLRRLRQKSDRLGSTPASAEEFWALQSVNFSVQEGEVVGVIGRNGAGKSTLLKIISRITEPTKGRVTITGRVASLLEVGTGFHPELTGRENIFLNGAILGMRQAEIRSRFDEIVSFAEVERFLDTPVKRYSSGMYVRLAFAVAAHLDPEILIIDEVLAVGDADFQKKCLRRMSEVSKGGRTVLFVSQQMNAIRNLCTRAVLLEAGQVVAEGPTAEVINRHLGSTSESATVWTYKPGSRIEDPAFTVNYFALVDEHLKPIERPLSADESVGVLIRGEVEIPSSITCVGYALYDEQDQLLWWTLQTDTERKSWPELTRGTNSLVTWIPRRLLNEGSYRVELMVSLHFQKWISQPAVNAPALQFSIRGNLSDSPYWVERRPGALALVLPFEKVKAK